MSWMIDQVQIAGELDLVGDWTDITSNVCEASLMTSSLLHHAGKAEGQHTSEDRELFEWYRDLAIMKSVRYCTKVPGKKPPMLHNKYVMGVLKHAQQRGHDDSNLGLPEDKEIYDMV